MDDVEPHATTRESGQIAGGSGPYDGVWYEAGRPVRLWIEARDCFDNAHETAIDPAPFSIKVIHRSGGRLAAPTASVRAANCSGSGAHCGLCCASYGRLPRKGRCGGAKGASGEWELYGSPYNLRIVPGPTRLPIDSCGPGLSSFDASALYSLSTLPLATCMATLVRRAATALR